MANSANWRVFIADANPLTRFGLRAVIDLHPCLSVCGEAGDAFEILELCEKEMPDLIVLDVLFPKYEGIQLLGDLARRHPLSRRLVVSAAGDALSIERAVRAGAHAYVTKHEEPAEILFALEKVYGGERFFSKRASEALLAAVGDRDSSKALKGLGDLSVRELQIFRLMGKKHGVTEIARELGVSVKTVETHQGRIKEKMGLRTGIQLHRAAERWNGKLAED